MDNKCNNNNKYRDNNDSNDDNSNSNSYYPLAFNIAIENGTFVVDELLTIVIFIAMLVLPEGNSSYYLL